MNKHERRLTIKRPSLIKFTLKVTKELNCTNTCKEVKAVAVFLFICHINLKMTIKINHTM